MEREEPEKNINPKPMGLEKESKQRFTISAYKKQMGLDEIPVIHIPIKKDGKHLYRVAGYFYPLKPETLERLNISNQRIICEVDREEWLDEMRKARDEQETPEQDDWWND